MRAQTIFPLVISTLLLGTGAWAQGHGRGHGFRAAGPRGWSQMSAPRTFRPTPMGRNFGFQGRPWHFAPHGPFFFPQSSIPFPGSQGAFFSPSGPQFFFFPSDSFFFSSSFFFPRHRFFGSPFFFDPFFSPFTFRHFGFPGFSSGFPTTPPFFLPPQAYAGYGGGYYGYSARPPYESTPPETRAPEAAPEYKPAEPPQSLKSPGASAAERLTPRDVLLTLDGQEQPPPNDGGPVTLGSGRHTLRIAAKPAPVSR